MVVVAVAVTLTVTVTLTVVVAVAGVCCDKLIAIILEIYCNISLQYQCCQYIAYCNRQLCNNNILQFE